MNPWRKPEIHSLYYFYQSPEIFIVSPLQMKPRLKSLARGLGVQSFSTLFTSQHPEPLAPTASAGKVMLSLRPTVLDLPLTALWFMEEQNSVQHGQKALLPSVSFSHLLILLPSHRLPPLHPSHTKTDKESSKLSKWWSGRRDYLWGWYKGYN